MTVSNGNWRGNYWGHSLFCSRFSRISRLKLQRTLRLKSMNREQRERREQGETDYTNFRSFRVFHGSLLGTLHFTTEGMKEAESFRKRLLSTGDTPFFIPFNAGETPRRIRHPEGGRFSPKPIRAYKGHSLFSHQEGERSRPPLPSLKRASLE